MKGKILNLLLIIFSFIGFLEWGQNHQMFLFQVEAELFSKIFKDPLSLLHPFTLLPFLGQIFLLLTLFQKQPGKILTYLGITGIGLLMALVFLIGCLSLNLLMLLSSIPFLVTSFFAIRYHWKQRKA